MSPGGDAAAVRGPLLVFGSLNVDSTSYVAAFPEPGETVLAREFRVALGGKGANQAVAAHIAGAEVELLARVGRDAAGDFALASLAGFGLDTGAVARADGPTGVAQITVADSGENTVIVTAGANLAIDAATVDAERERIARAALVLTQGELAPAAVERIAAVAGELGVRFVLNLAPPAPVAPAALAACDPLVLNEHEARALGIGSSLGDEASAAEWAQAASAAVGTTARSIVVTLGAAGAVVASADGTAEAPAPRVRAVDSTGAGDGFTGTLAAFLAEGRPLVEAVRIAVAAASLAVLAPGTVDSYAPRDAVLAAARP